MMKEVDAEKNPGLAKLPKKVRNNMGFMKDGGEVKYEYRGGGEVDLEKIADKSKLEAHLKSKDFFETDEYPKSSFKFESTEKMANGKYKVSGQMTIKNKINPENFVIKINLSRDKLVAVADVKIDRTKYGVVYNANQAKKDEWFFTRWFKSGADKFIDDVFEIRLNVVADKKN